MRRDLFLARVRHAVEAGRAYRVHPTEFTPGAGYVGAGATPLERLRDELNTVGVKAELVPDLATARSRLDELLRAHAPQRVLTWEHELLDRVGVAPAIEGVGAARVSHGTLATLSAEDQLATFLAADVCVSSVTFAVAETGSLVMASKPGQERLGSLISPIHIAIVEPAQVLPDVFDVFATLEKSGLGELPSNLVFITGPSKTGDIELTLYTGVHGPGVVYVLILQNAG